MDEMNHITIKDDYIGRLVEVSVLLDEPDGYVKTGAIVPRDSLRAYIEQYAPCVIWERCKLMKLCAKDGCNELLPIGVGCNICEGCLTEYQPEAVKPTSQYERVEAAVQ
jgi:hypothetical protein